MFHSQATCTAYLVPISHACIPHTGKREGDGNQYTWYKLWGEGSLSFTAYIETTF